MKPLSILFLPFVALQQDPWQNPWIKLTEDCESDQKCDLGENLDQLVIPESSVFNEHYSTVLAEVSFTSDQEFFITCQNCDKDNRDEWLLSDNLTIVEGENGMKKVQVRMSGKLDYDKPTSEMHQEQKFFFMLGTGQDNFGACRQSEYNCHFISVKLKNVVDERPTFIGEWGLTQLNLPDLTENENQDEILAAVLEKRRKDGNARCQKYRVKKKEKAATEETELEMLEKRNAFLREKEQKLTDRLTQMKQCYLALIRQKKIKFQ